MDGVLPGEERRSGGCAKGLGVVAVHDHPVVGQRVYVGGGDLVATVKTYIVEPLEGETN